MIPLEMYVKEGHFMKLSASARRLLALAASAFMLCCAGCANPEGDIDFTQVQEAAPADTTADPPLRIAFASVISPKETRQSYQLFVDYIAEERRQPAILLQRRTYEELNKLMDSGGADIAFFSTGAYAAYEGATPIELLAMAETDGSVFYQTYLIAAADSPITEFSQLRGKVFAFTDPLSYSGRQAVDFYLLDQGMTAESFFRSFFYTYNHDKSIWAVANHLADAASIDSQIYDFVRQTNPRLCSSVRIFASLPEAPTGPVVMRSSLPPEEKDDLRRIFYSMDQNEELRAAMKRIVIDRFVAPDAALYGELRRKYRLRSQLGAYHEQI